MNEIIRSVILGIVQGLTEFLPVSSSGHLELSKFLLKDSAMGEESLLMTMALHTATALSILVIFRKDIVEILRGLLQFEWNEKTSFSVKIILSMIPAAVVGLFFEEQVEQLFTQKIILVGFMLIITGLLLFLADQARNTTKKVSFANSIIIGLSQAIAILPGISRSGATISTTVLLGVDREQAARFSFLMVVPLILGKMGLIIYYGELNQNNTDLLPLASGFIAAFFTGLLACNWMIQLVKNSKLTYFSVYCFSVAALIFAAWFFGDTVGLKEMNIPPNRASLS